MRKVRPLARVPAPVAGESFVSHVERLAALHKVDLLVMLNTLGIIDDERYERLNGYGVLLDDGQLERFSIAAGLPREHAAGMLLSAYDGKAIDLRGVHPGDADALRKRAIDEWAYFSGSHACPHCLHETGGAWQLAWKLPWSFVCPKHKCYLVARCPSCERRLASGRTDRSLSPLFVRAVPSPGRCGNPKHHGVGGIGKSAVPCGHALTDIPTIPAGRAALGLQKALNDVLSGKSPMVLGTHVTPLEYFHDLRSLCALILYCAEPEDLGKIAGEELAAFSEFATQRNRILVERAESATPRNSARSRVFSVRQDSPELMAAVSGLAAKILMCADSEAMSAMLSPLAERCVARSPKFRWHIMQFFRFSERLAPSFHEGMAERATFNRSVGTRSVAAKDVKYGYEPRHVPQLLWADDFGRSFSQFFPGVRENSARRFCAMSLVKLCGDYTWGQAALLLGLPEHSGIKMANKCVGILAAQDAKRKFRRALHAVATRLSEKQDKVDFAFRREALADLCDIPREPWLGVCRAGGITPGQRSRRSRYAAAWVWAEFTGGDWTLAPALAEENVTNAREVYRAMSRNILPMIEFSLREYGKKLLSNHDC